MTTVSNNREDGHPNHVFCDFKMAKNLLKELVPRIRRLKRYKLTVKVFLDYFWLAVNYYNSQYGKDWFGAEGGFLAGARKYSEAHGKCLPLLQAGADEIWLPNGSQMPEMRDEWLSKGENNLLAVEAKCFAEFELWTATDAVNEQLKSLRKDPKDNRNQSTYVDETHPFYRVTLK